MYKYKCPRWWGNAIGVGNIYSPDGSSEKEVIKTATENSNQYTGSQTCDIYLLQQFELNIKLVKNYAGLTSIPTYVHKDNINKSNVQNEHSK